MGQSIVYVYKVGRMNYMTSWKLQKKLAMEVLNNVKTKGEPKHKLILVEHDPVYTIGLRTQDYTVEDEVRLRNLGAEFYRTNRGGLITFHGPGQLTAYPILHLRSFHKGLRWYISSLERAVVRCCHQFNIDAHTTLDTGIWIEDRKICSIGIQGRHVTTHGLALNCNIDMSWFSHIVPCGIEGKSVTSISNELNKDISVTDVLPHFLQSFAEEFHATLIEEENILPKI